MRNKKTEVVLVPLFLRSKCPSSDHCDKHLCFSGLVHVPLLLFSNFNCVVAKFRYYRGGTCITVTKAVKNSNTPIRRGGTCTTLTMDLKIWNTPICRGGAYTTLIKNQTEEEIQILKKWYMYYPKRHP